MNPFSLTNRVALVTGSSRGLGRAIAGAMAAAGATVVLNGRDAEALKSSCEEIAGQGGSADFAAFDVADTAAAKAGLASAISRHGRLDILVNNAGIPFREPLQDTGDDDWRRIIELDLSSCFILAREGAKVMTAQGAGSIIMVSSVMAQVSRPSNTAYTAAKGGLEALTRALAAELGPAGVTCNAIAPGWFRTDATRRYQDDPEYEAFVERRTPLGRWGKPEEIGNVAVFLASPAASYINGHVLTVDGGLTATI